MGFGPKLSGLRWEGGTIDLEVNKSHRQMKVDWLLIETDWSKDGARELKPDFISVSWSEMISKWIFLNSNVKKRFWLETIFFYFYI